MTGLLIFFLIYSAIIFSCLGGVWFFINYYDEIILKKDV